MEPITLEELFKIKLFSEVAEVAIIDQEFDQIASGIWSDVKTIIRNQHQSVIKNEVYSVIPVNKHDGKHAVLHIYLDRKKAKND